MKAVVEVLGCLPPEKVARIVLVTVDTAGENAGFGQMRCDAFVILVGALPHAQLVQVLPIMTTALTNVNTAMRVAIMGVMASGVLSPIQMNEPLPDIDASVMTIKLEPQDLVECDPVLRLDDEFADIRCCALHFLAALPSKQLLEAVPAIDAKLLDPNGKVRFTAVDVLRAMPGDHL